MFRCEKEKNDEKWSLIKGGLLEKRVIKRGF